MTGENDTERTFLRAIGTKEDCSDSDYLISRMRKARPRIQVVNI